MPALLASMLAEGRSHVNNPHGVLHQTAYVWPEWPSKENPPSYRYRNRLVCGSLIGYFIGRSSPRHGETRRGESMDKLKRLAIPLASLLALAIAVAASWRLTPVGH